MPKRSVCAFTLKGAGIPPSIEPGSENCRDVLSFLEAYEGPNDAAIGQRVDRIKPGARSVETAWYFVVIFDKAFRPEKWGISIDPKPNEPATWARSDTDKYEVVRCKFVSLPAKIRVEFNTP
jgi:hypothetical protein